MYSDVAAAGRYCSHTINLGKAVSVVLISRVRRLKPCRGGEERLCFSVVVAVFGPLHGGTCDGARPSLVCWCGLAQGHAHRVRFLRLLRRSVVSEDCLQVPSADCGVFRGLATAARGGHRKRAILPLAVGD